MNEIAGAMFAKDNKGTAALGIHSIIMDSAVIDLPKSHEFPLSHLLYGRRAWQIQDLCANLHAHPSI